MPGLKDRSLDMVTGQLACLKLWSALIYPEDDEARDAWLASARCGWLAKRPIHDESAGTLGRDLLEGLWSLSLAPGRVFENGVRRLRNLFRVAMVFHLTLRARHSTCEYQNVGHWREWVCKSEAIGADHMRNISGSFNNVSHLAAALLTTRFEEDELERIDSKARGFAADITEAGRNYWLVITAISEEKIEPMMRFFFSCLPVLDQPYFLRVARRSEFLRQRGEELRLLDRRLTWRFGNVEAESADLSPVPEEALEWLRSQFPGSA